MSDETTLLPCPFCGGEAETHEVTFPYHYWDVWCDGECFDHFCEKATEAKAIAAWNTRVEPPYDELLCCLENDWYISASWDGLRKFWCIELTEEGVRLRDAELKGGTCEPNWVLQGETQTQEFWRCECGNCGECFGVEDRSSFPFEITIGEVDIPNYCPNCGEQVSE